MWNKIYIWLKAKLALLVIAIMWGTLIYFSAPLMIAAYYHDKKHSAPLRKRWLYSILIGQDILVNCMLGGYHRTTISSELGNLKRMGSKTGTGVANFVDWLFEVFADQRNHCEEAIETSDEHFFHPLKATIGASLFFLTVTYNWVF